MKIVIDSDIQFLRGTLEPFAQVVYIKGDRICRNDIRDADAMIVRTRTRCDRALLEGSAVKFIATATIGFDHIDMDYCRRKDIVVATSAGCNARAVLQWVGAVLAADSSKQGWLPEEKTLGVVGVGNVGSLVASYGQHWGFQTLCCDPPRQAAEGGGFISLEELAEGADIVTFHVPFDRIGPYCTENLADSIFLKSLKSDAMVINSSRGEILDEAYLSEAVHSQRLSCAIDTWRGEPHIDKQLLSHSSYASQHIAGYSVQGKAMASAMAVNSLARHFGLPLKEWYPASVAQSSPRDISWDEMKASIKGYLDIDALTAALKSGADSFEKLRNDYKYRDEYY